MCGFPKIKEQPVFIFQGPILTNPPGIKAIDLDTEQSNIIENNLDSKCIKTVFNHKELKGINN